MVAAIRAVLVWLASAFGTQVAIGTAQWVAWRGFILFVVMTVFPIMLMNFLSDVWGVVVGVVASRVNGSGLPGGMVSLTGLAGCLGSALKLPESASLIISAIMFRLGLQMIPFVGLGR